MTTSYSTVTRWLQLCVLSVCALLAALVAAWLLTGGLSVSKVLLATVATAPLWLALPGLSAGRRRTYAWLTLAVVPYVVLGLTESVANPAARAWAASCLFGAFALFCLVIAYLRVTRAGG